MCAISASSIGAMAEYRAFCKSVTMGEDCNLTSDTAALVVQGVLGLAMILTLVVKWCCENPQRLFRVGVHAHANPSKRRTAAWRCVETQS